MVDGFPAKAVNPPKLVVERFRLAGGEVTVPDKDRTWLVAPELACWMEPPRLEEGAAEPAIRT